VGAGGGGGEQAGSGFRSVHVHDHVHARSVHDHGHVHVHVHDGGTGAVGDVDADVDAPVAVATTTGTTPASPVVRVEAERPYVAPDADLLVADDDGSKTSPGRPAWRRGGKSDASTTAPLIEGAVAKVKLNRGGMTLSLRIDFDNGSRAAFKPQQTNPQSNPRREIAAYRIDRLLGLDRVAPAVARTFTVDEILSLIPDKAGKQRFRDEAISKDGMVTGELSWWIPVIADGKVDGYSIDSRDGIVTWKRFLRAGARIPSADRVLVMQISDMIVFDFLIDNIDRWSGNNAKTSADGRVLYFMDNTFAFGTRKRGHSKSQTYLSRVQTFSKRLIGKLRGLSADDIRSALADDLGDFDLLLTSAEIAAMMSRRQIILDYVDGLIAKHGEDKVLAFP
jgi:hypothetical protein